MYGLTTSPAHLIIRWAGLGSSAHLKEAGLRPTWLPSLEGGDYHTWFLGNRSSSSAAMSDGEAIQPVRFITEAGQSNYVIHTVFIAVHVQKSLLATS